MNKARARGGDEMGGGWEEAQTPGFQRTGVDGEQLCRVAHLPHLDHAAEPRNRGETVGSRRGCCAHDSPGHTRAAVAEGEGGGGSALTSLPEEVAVHAPDGRGLVETAAHHATVAPRHRHQLSTSSAVLPVPVARDQRETHRSFRTGAMGKKRADDERRCLAREFPVFVPAPFRAGRHS